MSDHYDMTDEELKRKIQEAKQAPITLTLPTMSERRARLLHKFIQRLGWSDVRDLMEGDTHETVVALYEIRDALAKEGYES